MRSTIDRTPNAIRTGMILGTLLALLLTLAPALAGRCDPLGPGQPGATTSAAPADATPRAAEGTNRPRVSVHRGAGPQQEEPVLVAADWLRDLQGWFGGWLPGGPRTSL